MLDPYENDRVSPIEVSSVDFPPTPVSPSRRGPHHNRQWSSSTHGTTAGVEKPSWEPPPLPPIPPEKELGAWRKRSLKRCSYASQMSNYSTKGSFTADSELKYTRNISTVSVTPSRNFSRPTTRREPQMLSEDLNRQVGDLSPRVWSGRRKWLYTLAAATIAFTLTLASSIIAPAHSYFEHRYEVSPIITILPLSLYVAGLSFGPAFNRLCSEIGRSKLVSVVSLSLFALLTIGSTFVKSISGLVVCRALAGVCGSPALDISLMMLFKIWPADGRTFPFALYAATSFLGLTAGPVIGAYIIHAKDWTWTQYTVLFVLVPCMVLVVIQRDFHKGTLQRRMRIKETSQRSSREFLKLISGPIYALLTEPDVLLLSIYSGCNFATFYAIFAAFPRVFERTYGADTTSGLYLVGMLIGVVLSLVILILIMCNTSETRASSRELATEQEKVDDWKHDRPKDSCVSSAPSVSPRTKYSRNVSQSSLPSIRSRCHGPPQGPKKNVDLAIATATYVNGRPGNEGKRIMPERVLLILDQTPTFGDLCSQLEVYGLTFDRHVLARILVDTHPTAPTTPDFSEIASPWLLATSKSLHRHATAATLKMPTPPRPVALLGTPTSRSGDGVWPLTAASSQIHLAPQPVAALHGKRQNPPPAASSARRHLAIGVVGSFITAGSLFMCGWTAESKLPQVLPIVALGIFACGALLTFVSTIEYLMEAHGCTDGQYAVQGSTTVRYIFSAVFPLFAIPLFDNLNGAWATSVLGFIDAALGLVPLGLLVFGKATRKGQKGESAA